MDINWSIVAAGAGFAGARALLDEYSMWKARRSAVPLDWNPRTQAFEPDFKLKRLERWGRVAAWGLWAGFGIIGYNVVVNDWFVHWP